MRPKLLFIFLVLVSLACSLPFIGDKAASNRAAIGSAPSTQPAITPTVNATSLPPATSDSEGSASAELQVMGTISVSLDGEIREFETGSVMMEGEAQTLSSWNRAPLSTIPDLYQFEVWAVPAGALSAEGADLEALNSTALSFSFSQQSPQAGQQLRFTFPAPDALETAGFGYVTVEGESYVEYVMTEGSLDINLEKVQPGEAAVFNGSFQGTLSFAGEMGDSEAEVDPERSIRVEGTFNFDALKYDPVFD